jgi:3-phenylpropionate/trans-cinnamate dioxygenase ferredoxin subunit
MEALIDVAALNEIADGESLRVDVDGTPVCLVNLDGDVHAIHDTCTHALESLSGGYIEDGKIECPRHGAFFVIASGEAVTPPATLPLPTFKVEVRDGRVLVDPTPSHPHPLLQRKEFQHSLRGGSL